jgi:hypothetical protein
MLLIGFVWIFLGMAALFLAKPLVPGTWEDTGPAACMTTCLGAYLCGSIAVLAMEGPNAYGPPTIAGTGPGILASVVGGAVGFAVYIYDARRRIEV